MADAGTILDIPLHEAARTRFLNYAISVITSRALPDVRDGLKPVQRRILYTMAHDLKLWPDRPPIKCAKVVGGVLGSYHPHGDTAVYEALVRLAQDWVLRCPLVDGQGNFGSLDGDAPAAYRYTEARLRPLALEFIAELEQDTVDFRPNFDDSTIEPVVLPARFPQLLVNGCAGIAVGVATNLPPHNLREVVDACLALIKDPGRSTRELLGFVKGPDFPTGGELHITPTALEQLYEEGQGSLVLRGEVVAEEATGRWQRLIITSIPYMLPRSRLVEEIADRIQEGAIPGLVNVRDESAEDVRIVLELQSEAPARRVLQQLYDKTSLQATFHANFTCLTPEGLPARLGLKALLEAFLDFRRQVVRRRLEHEDRQLGERLHLLEGFMRVFRALDQAVTIIRRAEGREEAARQLRERFELDEAQVQAVLELRLYRLGKKDVELTRRDHDEKTRRRREVRSLLASPTAMQGLIAQELTDLKRRFSDARRTRIRLPEKRSNETQRYLVGVSAAGWVCRRGREESLPERPQDSWTHQLDLTSGQALILFTSLGGAFTLKVDDLPGEPRPIQKLAVLSDDERLVAAFSSAEKRSEAVYVASDGTGAVFSLDLFRTPGAARSGRRFARAQAPILGVLSLQGKERVILASSLGRAWSAPVSQLPRKTGRGVKLMALTPGDLLVGFALGSLNVRRVGATRTLRLTARKLPELSPGQEGVPVLARGRLELSPDE